MTRRKKPGQPDDTVESLQHPHPLVVDSLQDLHQFVQNICIQQQPQPPTTRQENDTTSTSTRTTLSRPLTLSDIRHVQQGNVLLVLCVDQYPHPSTTTTTDNGWTSWTIVTAQRNYREPNRRMLLDQYFEHVTSCTTTTRKQTATTDSLSSSTNHHHHHHQPHWNHETKTTTQSLWRWLVQRILVWGTDNDHHRINQTRISRWYQWQLPYLASHEAYLLSEFIQALEEPPPTANRNNNHDSQHVQQTLERLFWNCNVSRIVVQSLGPRFDFVFHWSTALSWNKWFDLWGQIPLLGRLTRFPPTENDVDTRRHALAAIFRVVLGPGHWWTRVLTGGREGLVTDHPEIVAQNLAAESNGFEWANRNQYVYDTHILMLVR